MPKSKEVEELLHAATPRPSHDSERHLIDAWRRTGLEDDLEDSSSDSVPNVIESTSKL